MPSIYKDIKDKTLNLSLSKSDVLTVVVDNDIDINYNLENGDYKILVFINSDNKNITINEKGQIINSNVEINYLELNDIEFKQTNNIDVCKDSTLTVNTTYLGANNKQIDFRLVNLESDSSVYISNNVVCLNEASFVLNVVGKIVKGAKRSKCLQKSRCLTFENPKAAKVLPVLEIDENDVEASHSLSSGTIDEDVLFYMNSRGLDKRAALSLLLTSYLMPNEEFYKSFEYGMELKEIADRKVEKICLM